jgi:hypothetical protein
MKGVMKAMLVKKLRWVVGGLVVLAALGFIGLGYHAGDGPGSAQAAPPDKPRSELEALRRENELLKLNLEVVLEKVQAQETELRALRNRPASGGGSSGGTSGGILGAPSSGMLGMPSGGMKGLGGSFSGGSNSLGGGISGGFGNLGGVPTSGLGNPHNPLQSGGFSGLTGSSGGTLGGPQQPGLSKSTAPKEPTDPVKDAERALKELRETRDPEAKRRATEALEKAVEKLKQQGKSEQPPTGSGKKDG